MVVSSHRSGTTPCRFVACFACLVQATGEWGRGDVTSACVNGFMVADAAMRKSGVTSGTTAVLALVSPQEIVVANCGDSRSVLRCDAQQSYHHRHHHRPRTRLGEPAFLKPSQRSLAFCFGVCFQGEDVDYPGRGFVDCRVACSAVPVLAFGDGVDSACIEEAGGEGGRQ